MTAFSDYPAPAEHPLHPTAEQIHDYLRALRARLRRRRAHPLRHARRGRAARAGRSTASRSTRSSSPPGRFRKPRLPAVVGGFRGELLHAFDYPGAEPFRDRTTLVYGNGISGLEIASDLAPHAPVVSAFRKPRYVIQKVVGGVSSDWQWYTLFGALERRRLPPEEWGRPAARAHPARGGQPRRLRRARAERGPSRRRASRCARTTSPRCATAASSAARRSRRSTGRTSRSPTARPQPVDAIVCATGYDLDLPYCADRLRPRSGRISRSTSGPSIRTCRASASSASSSRRARTSRCSSSRRAGSSPSGAARSTLPDEADARGDRAPPPPLDAHNALALTLSEELGVAPEPARLARPRRAAALRPDAAAALPALGSRGAAGRGRAVRRAARGVAARAGRPRHGAYLIAGSTCWSLLVRLPGLVACAFQAEAAALKSDDGASL